MYSIRLLTLLFCIVTPAKAQIAIKATLSLVINSVPSEDITEESIEEKAILIELKNISSESLIIFHNKPVRDHIVTFVDSIDINVFNKKLVKPKFTSKPNFNGLYQKLIDSNKANQQLFQQISLSSLNDLGIEVNDTVSNGKVYGIILDPQQTFRDLKYFRKELELPGNYLYRYSPLHVEAKIKSSTLSIDGKRYRIVLAKNITSNEFNLTTFKN